MKAVGHPNSEGMSKVSHGHFLELGTKYILMPIEKVLFG